MTTRYCLANATVFGSTGKPSEEAACISVDGGRIAGVSKDPPHGWPLVDVNKRLVLPGLIDAHVHLCSHRKPQLDPEGVGLEQIRPFSLVHEAQILLQHGITSVRDCGSYGDVLFALRSAADQGLVPAPRLVLCGGIVSTTSPGAKAFKGMYAVGDGPVELCKAVRQQVSAGADFIKVMATGATNLRTDDLERPEMTETELGAVVNEAHRLHRRVACHVEGPTGLETAVLCGVDSIEHAECAYRRPDLLARMAESEIVLVPTLAVYEAEAEGQKDVPQWLPERSRRSLESGLRTVAAAKREGVQIATGSDFGPSGKNAREVALLCEAGLSVNEALVAATATAARASGLEEKVGTLEAGKVADIVVLDRTQLDDPSVLAQPGACWMVLQHGNLVAGHDDARRASQFDNEKFSGAAA